ncbi:MAG: SAP domain-containing protein [Deltaproteobacteria bacterium]|nr:SAP domain-containing protein [Deltaproteobacteria bacterium]
MTQAFDWTRSTAHVELLSKFRTPRPTGDFGPDYQMPALGESAPQAVARFVQTAHLAPATLPERTATLTVRQLKAGLKHAGCRVTGKKADLVERLLAEAPVQAEKATAALPTLHALSESGRALVQQYRSWQQQRLDAAIAEVSILLRSNDLRGAVARHRTFAALDPWRDPADAYADDEQLVVLQLLAAAQPAILHTVARESMGTLRLAAALTHFFGRAGRESVPAGFAAGSHLDDETAVRMMSFHINHLRRRETYLSIRVEQVSVSSCDDERTCEACKALDGRSFSGKAIPEMPHPHCTSPSGCRCTIMMADPI